MKTMALALFDQGMTTTVNALTQLDATPSDYLRPHEAGRWDRDQHPNEPGN
jgi:hypothetical protein